MLFGISPLTTREGGGGEGAGYVAILSIPFKVPIRFSLMEMLSSSRALVDLADELCECTMKNV